MTNIDPFEARQRIDELEGPFHLGHAYARVERGTYMPDGKPETDGEHAISLAIIATAYAMKYYPELDPYKVFFYCVMHDVDEFLHGDTPTIGATKETFRVKDAEEAEAAIERGKILANFEQFNTLINQMSDLSIPENAFGKAFDKIAPGYTHAANRGSVLIEKYGIHSLDDILAATTETDRKMYVYAKSFVDVLAMRQEMHVINSEHITNREVWVDMPLFQIDR